MSDPIVYALARGLHLLIAAQIARWLGHKDYREMQAREEVSIVLVAGVWIAFVVVLVGYLMPSSATTTNDEVGAQATVSRGIQ